MITLPWIMAAVYSHATTTKLPSNRQQFQYWLWHVKISRKTQTPLEQNGWIQFQRHLHFCSFCSKLTSLRSKSNLKMSDSSFLFLWMGRSKNVSWASFPTSQRNHGSLTRVETLTMQWHQLPLAFNYCPFYSNPLPCLSAGTKLNICLSACLIVQLVDLFRKQELAAEGVRF